MKTRFSAAAKQLLISRIFSLVLVIGAYCCPFGSVSAANTNSPHQPAVVDLMRLLEVRTDLKSELEQAIRSSNRPGIADLSDYYAFLDRMVKAVPTAENWLPMRLELYYIVDNSPKDRLRNDAAFQQWLHGFVNDLGSFLDSPESAQCYVPPSLSPNFFSNPVFFQGI